MGAKFVQFILSHSDLRVMSRIEYSYGIYTSEKNLQKLQNFAKSANKGKINEVQGGA